MKGVARKEFVKIIADEEECLSCKMLISCRELLYNGSSRSTITIRDSRHSTHHVVDIFSNFALVYSAACTENFLCETSFL